MQKRVLAINDISCIGRCSLTVALPVISAAGIECSVLPTALLSTHTGGFEGFTFRDLTDGIGEIAAHWKKLGIAFDAVYSGYLGSVSQVDQVLDLADDFAAPPVPLIVDPVMGDAGRLYANFDVDFVREMRKLCARADIITPNLTEAAFLLGEEYRGDDYDEEYVRQLLKRLTGLGAASVVVSGISFGEGELGAASYDAESGEFGYHAAEYVDGFFHGAGDVFASVLCSALVLGMSTSRAICEAVDFTAACIRHSARVQEDSRFGLCFEPLLGRLGDLWHDPRP